MRRSMLTLGLLFVLIGVFLISKGPQLLAPLAQTLGLVTNAQSTAVQMAPTLVSVPPSNYTFVTTDLTAGVQVYGTLMVGDGKEIAFYVMNEGNFSEWRGGHPSVVELARPYFISGNFTFTPNASGTYFFVFDNQDSNRRSVILNLSIVQSQTVLNPTVEFAGYEAIAVGIVLTVVGAKTGRKKEKQTPEPKLEATLGWSCKFCGAKNSNDLVFCSKCDRSRN